MPRHLTKCYLNILFVLFHLRPDRQTDRVTINGDYLSTGDGERLCAPITHLERHVVDAVPPALTNRRTHQTQEREDQKMRTLCSRPFAVASLAIGALTLSALQTQGHDFTQTNLVSNIDGLATITDPQLVNPWGVSHSDTSPFWVSNQRQNTTTLYMVTGETTVTKVNINPPTGFVAIPTTESGGPQGPTGQVNNANPSPSSFPVAHDDGTDGASARFIF